MMFNMEQKRVLNLSMSQIDDGFYFMAKTFVMLL